MPICQKPGCRDCRVKLGHFSIEALRAGDEMRLEEFTNTWAKFDVIVRCKRIEQGDEPGWYEIEIVGNDERAASFSMNLKTDVSLPELLDKADDLLRFVFGAT